MRAPADSGRPMTPAETLTAAADRIERVARAATPGPWRAAEQTHGEWTGIQSQFAALGHMHGAADAAHIALWSPDVALLLVPILRAEAERERIREEAVGFPIPPNPHLLALAERINDEIGDRA